MDFNKASLTRFFNTPNVLRYFRNKVFQIVVKRIKDLGFFYLVITGLEATLNICQIIVFLLESFFQIYLVKTRKEFSNSAN